MTKSVTPRCCNRHPALRPAIPPPTMTTGTLPRRGVAPRVNGVRNRCPRAPPSSTKAPAGPRRLLHDRPTSAALRNRRREIVVTSLPVDRVPLALVVADERLVV